jgi:outer membrane protein
MKTTVKIITTVLGVFLMLMVFAPSSYAKKGKVGYVNLSVVFDAYQKTKTFDAELEKEATGKRAERDDLVNTIKKLRDELELLSEGKKADKQGVIDDMVRELQAFDRDAREKLRRKRDEMLREILGEINQIVKSYGDEEGFEYIFNDRVLLYKDESSDLSQEIIKRLNAKE